MGVRRARDPAALADGVRARSPGARERTLSNTATPVRAGPRAARALAIAANLPDRQNEDADSARAEDDSTHSQAPGGKMPR